MAHRGASAARAREVTRCTRAAIATAHDAIAAARVVHPPRRRGCDLVVHPRWGWACAL